MERKHIMRYPGMIAYLESTPGFGCHQFGLEPLHLSVKNG